MNKNELIRAVASETDNTIALSKTMVTAVLNTIQDTVAGEDVVLMGFGTFKTKQVDSRIRRNPNTGEEVQCDPYVKVGFTPGSVLKETVNK